LKTRPPETIRTEAIPPASATRYLSVIVEPAVLVIVDPISAYMGKTDSHKNTDVRAVLAPLAELAERTETAVLALQHLNKGTGPAIYRATGSLAFVAAARAVWCVVKDKDDPSIRLMLPIKCNLAPDTEGTSYKVVASPDNPDVPVLAWSTEPVRITADEAMGNDETGAVRAVADWLRDLLHEGPVAASEIQERAEGEGHAWRTVQRAKERLGVQAEKSGFKGGWEWKLPQERQ